MKTKPLPLILLTLLILAATGLMCPAKSPNEIATTIAPLISENTVCVAYFDITTLEPEQIAQSLKSLCNSIREAASFDVQLSREMNAKLPPNEIFDELPNEMSKALDLVHDQCGVTEAYLLVTFPIQTCLVVPIRDGVKTEFLDENKFVRHKEFMLFPNPHLFNPFSLSPTPQEQVNRMFGAGFVAMERPELLEGLTLVGDRPFRATAFLPTYAKMLFTEMMPPLPEPFDTLDVGEIVDALQLLAVGFDPNTMQAELILKSKDQHAAESFRELLFSLSDKMTQLVQARPMYERIGAPVIIFANVLNQNADFLFPQPENGTTRVLLQADSIQSPLARLFESIVTESKTGVMSYVSQSNFCKNNIKMITLAMHCYHDSWKQFPPVFTTDGDGKPLHSWRVALLPYLEEIELYEQIRRDEPWDSEWNRQFHNQCPRVLQCPTMSNSDDDITEMVAGGTSYSFVVGRDTYPLPDGQAFSFSRISDGTSNTICVVERQTPINWMCPDQELTQEEAFRGLTDSTSGIGLRHESAGKTGLNTGFFDGFVRFIGDDIPPDTWKAILTRAGGEVVNLP
ncbi:MAG: DUF1559 domain-containing protein [Planctomycetaceae bacterium]|nr:DUF1559 domain-containing protein [Planctomycetaceae bacterium]